MKTILISAASVLALTAAAQAQVQGAASEATTLDKITVTTPLRRASALERSTSSVTVITEEEIARSPATDLSALLTTIPGINITSYGGMGAGISTGLRGTSGAQTLVLIDGVNARSATLGTTSLFNIPLGAIERVEIAKGAHSAQYGADAIGGVINIITKSGGAGCPDGKAICTTVSAGVLYPWGGHAGVDTRGTTQDGTRFSIGGRLIGTRGYDFTTQPTEPDDDGFLLGSANLSLSKDFLWGEGYASLLYSRSRGEYDDAWGGPNEADYANLAAKIGARIDHAHDWQSRVELSAGYDDQDNFRRGTPMRDIYQTYRYGIFASTSKEFNTGNVGHQLTVGGEAYQETVDSTVAYAVTARSVGSMFVQHSMEFDALTVDGGIRYDHNGTYGDATTYNIGASYEIAQGLVGRASYATGFRVPTFNELYGFGGNLNLKPERSEGYEIGFAWRPTDATTMDVAFYQTRVRDQINWDEVTPGNWIPVNIGVVNITGFEAALDHRFNARWRAKLGLDVREVRDQNGDRVANQEKLKLAAEIGFAATEQLDLTARIRYVERGNSVTLPAYTVVDFGAVYALDKQSELKVSVENLFDTQYSTNPTFRSPGRSFNLSFSRTF